MKSNEDKISGRRSKNLVRSYSYSCLLSLVVADTFLYLLSAYITLTSMLVTMLA